MSLRSDYIDPEVLEHILAALTPENELAMRVSLATGLRISDVLSIKTEQLRMGQRFTVRESKTNKSRRVYIPECLYERLLGVMGKYYVFEGRLDARKPRTRQAVWRDLRRAAAAFRVSEAIVLSPHSARKVFAVESFRRFGSPDRVQRLLNHGEQSVTMLYLAAEAVTRRKLHGGTDPRRGRKPRK